MAVLGEFVPEEEAEVVRRGVEGEGEGGTGDVGEKSGSIWFRFGVPFPLAIEQSIESELSGQG